MRVASFLGGKHANFNFGPWRRDAGIGAAEVASALAQLHALAPDVDVLALTNQPESWEQVRNPLLALSHQESPSEGYRLSLAGGGTAVLARAYSSNTRARLRNKERKLQAIPGYRYARAESRADVERYLAAFLAQKAERLATQGIGNVFASPGVPEFLREACLSGLEAGTPLIELHVLDSDTGVLALFGGVSDGRRFSAMINSIALGEHTKYSPGLILLNYLVADCADRGLVTFDLGVGEAEYKALLCDEIEPLFDSFVPLSPRGRLLAPALALKARAKRAIKRSSALWSLAQKLRRFR
jgi:CelD/BcsL family acetyltransferase involved in cellulose biosynthesis